MAWMTLSIKLLLSPTCALIAATFSALRPTPMIGQHVVGFQDLHHRDDEVLTDALPRLQAGLSDPRQLAAP
jgi:hypothetical protein